MLTTCSLARGEMQPWNQNDGLVIGEYSAFQTTLGQVNLVKMLQQEQDWTLEFKRTELGFLGHCRRHSTSRQWPSCFWRLKVICQLSSDPHSLLLSSGLVILSSLWTYYWTILTFLRYSPWGMVNCCILYAYVLGLQFYCFSMLKTRKWFNFVSVFSKSNNSWFYLFCFLIILFICTN